MPNARVLRDMKARIGVKNNEVARRAYLYVARNQALSPQIRHQAQLQLNTFGRYTRPGTVKNRCGETGRGRGVISEFALCRVGFSFSKSGTDRRAVPVQIKSLGWRTVGRSKSLLVEVIDFTFLKFYFAVHSRYGRDNYKTMFVKWTQEFRRICHLASTLAHPSLFSIGS